MKSAAIIGYGYVGKAMARFLEKHYELWVHDPVLEKALGYPSPVRLCSKPEANKCDVSFVCVPSPMGRDGSCNTSIVEEVVGWLETPLIIIKSTVEPGTTDRLRQQTGKHVVFSPEYCGESKYWSPYLFDRDIKETPFFIFGGDREDTRRCVEFYLPVTGPAKTYRQTDAKSAEMAKYMENSFYAAKITFCYEMAQICQKAGLDYNEVRELWLLDPRVNPMHTAVFPDNKLPWSGKCYPKDISALAAFAREVGYDPALLKSVMACNEKIGEERAKA